jgi:hypothetical protein
MTSSTLAHRIWAKPRIEHKYWSVRDAHNRAISREKQMKEYDLLLSDLSVTVPCAGGFGLRLPSGRDLALTAFAFDKLSEIAEIPADFARSLPAPLVRDLFAERLPSRSGSDLRQIYVRAKGDDLIVRDFAGVAYERTPMARSMGALSALLDQGWVHPPGRPIASDPRTRPATEADVLDWARHSNGLSIKVGDSIAPCAVYMDDREAHVVMLRQGSEIDIGGNVTHECLIANFSDLATGKGARLIYGRMTGVCGNLILDGWSEIGRMSLAHRPGVNVRLDQALEHVAKPIDPSKMIEAIEISRKRVLAEKIEDVTDAAFSALRRLPWAASIGKKMIEAGVSAAVKGEDRYGDPRTLWALHNGLTEISQTRPMEQRLKIDAAASRLLTIDV